MKPESCKDFPELHSLLPQSSETTLQRPATLHLYSLNQDIPLEYCFFNLYHEPILVCIDSPDRKILNALCRDYPGLKWAYDRNRRTAPLYDYKKKSWCSLPKPTVSHNKSALPGPYLTILFIIGIILLLWALLQP